MLPFSFGGRTEQDAIQAAAAGGRYIAGGTTLIDLMREEVERPKRLIDLNALPLGDVRVEGSDLVIGALARMAQVAAHPDTLLLQPLIAETLIEGASPQLRNMASIGGNLMQRVRCPYFRMRDAACNKRDPAAGCSAIDEINGSSAILGTSDHCVATHPSDLAVSLVALDATLRVRGPQGERSFPVEELYRLPGTTPHLEHTLRPGELIIEVHVPGGSHARRARYLKVREPLVLRVRARLDGCGARHRGWRDSPGPPRGRRCRHSSLAHARLRASADREGAKIERPSRRPPGSPWKEFGRSQEIATKSSCCRGPWSVPSKWPKRSHDQQCDRKTAGPG